MPLVVVGKIKGTNVIEALDAVANRAGLSLGMTLATARALHPTLLVAESDTEADRAMLEHIADWCERYTPCIGLLQNSGFVLDITGASHLVGGEVALLADIKTRLAAQGFTTCAAIAGTAEAARAIASFGDSGIIEPGMEPQRVAQLPLAAQQPAHR
jgi:protein ImuB